MDSNTLGYNTGSSKGVANSLREYASSVAHSMPRSHRDFRSPTAVALESKKSVGRTQVAQVDELTSEGRVDHRVD